MTDTLAPDIRATIKAAGKALSIGEIAKALGVSRAKVSNACFNMARVDVLVKSGKPNCTQRFDLGRDLRKSGWAQTSSTPTAIAKREARKRATDARRTEREAKAAERARVAAAKLAEQETRQQRKAKRQQPHLAVLAKSAEQRSAKDRAVQKPKPEAVRAMTSDDFIREGGKIERLPMGAVSEAGRLKHVGGWREVFTESWKRRELSA